MSLRSPPCGWFGSWPGIHPGRGGRWWRRATGLWNGPRDQAANGPTRPRGAAPRIPSQDACQAPEIQPGAPDRLTGVPHIVRNFPRHHPLIPFHEGGHTGAAPTLSAAFPQRGRSPDEGNAAERAGAALRTGSEVSIIEWRWSFIWIRYIQGRSSRMIIGFPKRDFTSG